MLGQAAYVAAETVQNILLYNAGEPQGGARVVGGVPGTKTEGQLNRRAILRLPEWVFRQPETFFLTC